MRRAYTIQSGLVAILIYILIILIAILAFVQNEKEEQPAGSKEQVIKVDMSGIDMPQNQKSSKNEETTEPKKIENTSKEKIEPIEEEPKETERLNKPEAIKQKENNSKPSLVRKKEKFDINTVVKKTSIVKKPTKETPKTNAVTPKLTKDTTSLFETIDAKAPTKSVNKAVAPQKQTTSTSAPVVVAKASSKASDLISGAPSVKSSGVEDGYKSKIKSILNNWPAQSDFAGNKARIKFVIEPSGRFEFNVINLSSNEEFNKGLVQYLKQLQKVGFGAHGGNRAYVFDVDFIAER